MSKKIVIIGGGVAGLSAGIYARMNGFETEIIEMHSIGGGQCTAWERNGYRFDYCLRWLVGTRTGPFNDIWRETNAINDSVEVVNHETHTKMYAEDGSEFQLLTNLEKWENYLIDIAPEDTKSIRKMCNDMRKSSSIRPFQNAPGLRKVTDYLSALITSYSFLILYFRFKKKTCREYFDELNIKNPKLKFFLYNLYATRDYSAFAFIMMFAWFNQKNAGYIIGGSLPMAKRMTDKYLSLDGTFSTGKKVKEIIVENNIAKGVTLTDNNVIKADYVISAADGRTTIFEMLNGKYVSEHITNAYNNWDLFNPIVQVSFGVNKEIQTDCPVQTWLIKNRNIGMTRLDHGYSIMNYHFDPTMAPKGKTSIILRFVSPWALWKDLDGEMYKKEKQQIEKEAREILETHFAGIAEHIEVVDVATPKTNVRYTGVWNAAYEGFLASSKNLNANIDSTLPGLSKFYMAGQWLFPGGGLPPSGQSGKWAIQLICHEEKLKFKIL